MAKDDYFVIIYDILSYLYLCLKNGDKVEKARLYASTYGISESYWLYILESLLEQGYTKGYTITKFEDKVGHSDLKTIQITPVGIQYLFDDELLKKAGKELRALNSGAKGISL